MRRKEAFEKENVLIQAGACAVTLLPSLGGKIASIRIGDTELLQAPLNAYATRTSTMNFEDGDCGGWDECLPSVAACTLETEDGPTPIPDHGDLWRVEWQEPESKPDKAGISRSLTLRGTCFSVPLELERTLTLTEQVGAAKPGWRLRLNYVLRNKGGNATPWAWAAHPLFAVEEGDRIVLPDSIQDVQVESSRGGRLGRKGARISWPLPHAAMKENDLSVVASTQAQTGDKLFAGPLRAGQNWCVLERPSAGLRIKVEQDLPVTPYLGLWLCYGGWPERAGGKQMCVAIEPATAPVDSLAETGPWSRMLAAGESCSWLMDVQIETI